MSIHTDKLIVKKRNGDWDQENLKSWLEYTQFCLLDEIPKTVLNLGLLPFCPSFRVDQLRSISRGSPRQRGADWIRHHVAGVLLKQRVQLPAYLLPITQLTFSVVRDKCRKFPSPVPNGLGKHKNMPPDGSAEMSSISKTRRITMRVTSPNDFPALEPALYSTPRRQEITHRSVASKRPSTAVTAPF